MEKSKILEALIIHFSNGNKAQFACKLGVKPQTINTWINRNTFDIELIYSKCECISGDWLLTGEGEMLKTSSPSEEPILVTSERFFSIIESQQRTIENLSTKIR